MSLPNEVRAELDRADAVDAAQVLILAGVELGEAGRARADAEFAEQLGRAPAARILTWDAEDDRWSHVLGSQSVSDVAALVPGDLPPVLRIGVRGTDAGAVVERILASPLVASAFVAFDRADGALRRRPW